MKSASNIKKVLMGILFGSDILLTLFFLITSLIMVITMPDRIEQALGHYQNNYIGFLQQNPHLFMYLIVLPMLALFLANIVAFVLYLIRVGKKSAKE